MSKKKDKEIKTENKTEEVCHDDVASVESDHPSDQALIAELEDKLLRSRAEIENLSRRHLVDLEKAHKYGLKIYCPNCCLLLTTLSMLLTILVMTVDLKMRRH